MTNTGPPWFAADEAERQRAIALQVEVSKRAAFQAALQARLRGNTQRARQTLYNFMPLRRT